MRFVVSSVSLILAAACSSDPAPLGNLTVGTQDGGDATTSTGGAAAVDTGASTGVTGGGSTTAALPLDTTGDAPVEPSCAAIDVLIVAPSGPPTIDVGYHADEQAKLIAQIQSLTEGLATRLPEADVRYVVVDTRGPNACQSACLGLGTPVSACAPYTCENAPNLGYCDKVAGTALWMTDAFVGCLAEHEDHFVAGNDPELHEKLACLLTSVGERASGGVFGAILDGLDPLVRGPGGCNDGLFRDEAMLVIVGAQDFDGYGGYVEAAIGRLHEAKGSESLASVVGVLLADETAEGSMCPNGFQPPPVVLDYFLEQLGENGIRGDVCADDYGGFVTSLLDTTVSACGALEGG